MGRRPRLPTVPEDVVTFVLIAIAILALPILALPILGLVLAGLAIHRQRMSTQGPLRIALYALVLVGLLFLLSPTTRYGVLTLLS